MLYKKEIIEDNRKLKAENKKLKDEILRLDKIIYKLERALKGNIKDLKDCYEMQNRIDEDRLILNYLQKLKDSDKE